MNFKLADQMGLKRYWLRCAVCVHVCVCTSVCVKAEAVLGRRGCIGRPLLEWVRKISLAVFFFFSFFIIQFYVFLTSFWEGGVPFSPNILHRTCNKKLLDFLYVHIEGAGGPG